MAVGGTSASTARGHAMGVAADDDIGVAAGKQ